MTILFATHPRYMDHDTGRGHPERPARLTAVLEGADAADLGGELEWVQPRPATRTELERVHPSTYISALEEFCRNGGGRLDPDTTAGQGSFEAATLAAGAGVDAVERLDRGEADAAFCAVRPPGHHAAPAIAQGFCLFNNVAVVAAALADRGERVLIVDIDAHHGNGTQDVFYEDGRIAYVSFHEYPLYPGTGKLHETGAGAGAGFNINFPLPAGATGDVYRAGLAEVVDPLVDSWQPTWLVVSAGFDAHRRDPLTGLGLSAGDFADLTMSLVGSVPPGRRLLFLEGGYDLEALAGSAAACLAALAGGGYRPEPPTSGGPGHEIVTAVAELRRE